MQKELKDYIKEVGNIICTIGHTLIYGMPYKVDDFNAPVELETYNRFVSTNGRGFVSLTNTYKQIEPSSIKPDFELNELVTNIHKAIHKCTSDKKTGDLNHFFSNIAYDITSLIRSGNDAKRIYQVILEKNSEMLKDILLSKEDINTIAKDIMECSIPKELCIREGSTILSLTSSEGMSLLYKSTVAPEGIQLLVDNPNLVAKIIEDRLNHIVTAKRHEGQSALFWLAGTPDGRKIFMGNPDLVAKITEDGLNQIVTVAGCKGRSALFWLACTPDGRAILDKYSSLELFAQAKVLNSLKKRSTEFYTAHKK
jgi:hypothetical protein